jgi:Trm5-related predicted tRNA methylase
MKIDAYQRRRLPEQVAEAVATILEYLWDHELRDYLGRAPEEQETHILNELLLVRQFLQGRRPGKQRRDLKA